jgi:hypothetical protein
MSGTKMTHAEIADRVENCYELRYGDTAFKYKDYIAYCHKNYGDKSEKTYTSYWMKAKEAYMEAWRERLNKSLSPAVDELIRLLANESSQVRQKAVDQIMKYTGNDIERIQSEMTIQNIDLKWGDETKE